MIDADLGYLLFLTVVTAAAYFPFYYFIHHYHTGKWPTKLTSRSLTSVTLIVVFSLAVYAVSYSLPGVADGWGNRIIHTFGGGFLGVLLCYLAARDSKLLVVRWHYFIFCFMLVSTLGVFNEIAESVLQNFFQFTASTNINDTWLDLISNTVGIILGGTILTPLLKHK